MDPTQRTRRPDEADAPGTISIVIPALNEERLLGGLLSDLENQSRPPDEVFVVDAGSDDATVAVAERFPFVEVVKSTPPVAVGRNAGGRRTSGDVIVFLDADARLQEDFLERFVGEFRRRGYDLACPLYYPHESTRAVEIFHDLFNLITRAFQNLSPSGAGTCIAVRGGLFRDSAGFDPFFKFDDIELIRRLSEGRRFGIVEEKVFVSDRRYREHGVARAILEYSLMALLFALGRFAWTNRIGYEFGNHEN